MLEGGRVPAARDRRVLPVGRRVSGPACTRNCTSIFLRADVMACGQSAFTCKRAAFCGGVWERGLVGARVGFAMAPAGPAAA